MLVPQAPAAPRYARLAEVLLYLAPEPEALTALVRLEDTGAHPRVPWRRPLTAGERHVLTPAWKARGEPYDDMAHVYAEPVGALQP